jgi:putative ABC transport system substrate-binding protein
MSQVADPVGGGLVASLARPGSNVTGLTMMSPDLAGKQLQLLKEMVPKVSRVAFLRNPDNPASAAGLREAEVAARALGVRIQNSGGAESPGDRQRLPGDDQGARGRRAATFVDKILKGAKPADLPVAQPTKFELVINLRTAKAIGLTIPPSLAQRAGQIID